jgi:hypothetical protein
MLQILAQQLLLQIPYDFYEEELILVQIEFTQDDPTTTQGIQLWSLSLLGVSHQDGVEISV